MGSHTSAYELAKAIADGNAAKSDLITIGDGLLANSVQLYGAVGDGVTDDTVAIQAAIDAASTDGGYVLIPPTSSFYLTTDALVARSNVSIEISPGAEVRNTYSGWDYSEHTFVVGRCTRTDIAQVKGPKETAHSLGAISFGNLITNGNFTTDTGWTKGGNWRINAAGSNVADLSAVGGADVLSQTPTSALVEGRSYWVTYTVSNRSAGSLTVSVGGTAGTSQTTDDTYEETIVAGSGSLIEFTTSTDWDGDLDDVYVHEVDGARTATIGLRWDNTAETFTNAVTYTAEVGDLVLVVTTDDLASDPTLPMPSGVYLRKIMSVSGSVVTFDKEILQSGTYMIVQMDYPNGYSPLAVTGKAVNRHVAVENFHIFGGGKVRSNSTAPWIFDAALNCSVDNIETYGWTPVYGNTVRQCSFTRLYGTCTRSLIELAMGHEDVIVDGLDYTWEDVGESLGGFSVLQCTERGDNVVIKNVNFGGNWNGAKLTLFSAGGVSLENARMTTSATQRLLTFGGSSAYSRNGTYHFRNVHVSTDHFLDNYLIYNSTAVDYFTLENVSVDGLHALSDAVNLVVGSTGYVNNLRIVQGTGNIRLNSEDIFVGHIEGGGPLIGGIPTSATTAELEDIGDRINTKYKRVGKQVFNTTTNVTVTSVGTGAGSHWYTAAGVDTHTPV